MLQSLRVAHGASKAALGALAAVSLTACPMLASDPSVSFSADPAVVASGSASTLRWSTTDATSCQASGAWTGPKPPSGAESTGALSATSTYTLTCTGDGGSATQSITVTVSGAPTPPPASPASATLSWNPSPDADVIGYRVYFGTASRAYNQPRGAGLDTKGTTRFVVDNLTRGQRYYFAVTAYDAAGNESAFSAEVSKLAQ